MQSFKLNVEKRHTTQINMSAGAVQSPGQEFWPLDRQSHCFLWEVGPWEKVHHLLPHLTFTRPPGSAKKMRQGHPLVWGAPGRSPFCPGKKLKAPGQEGPGGLVPGPQS